MGSQLRLAAAIVAPLVFAMPASADETPKRGGILTYMIPADAPPSFDGHREATFATVHAVAPFYSVLVRANPQNPGSTTDFVCDVCTEIPEPADGGRTYPFTIRDDVKFEDGTRLTADDVAASWNKIVAPAEGILSPRRGYYSMIDKVEATDPKTVVFRLKYATAAFLPAIADPYAFIYQKKILDKDPFSTIDTVGVGFLVRTAVEKGRKARPDIKLGICGEHGGDPSSIHFFEKVGLNYVSMSPYRVPVARLAAAQAALSVKVGG
jgi:ABC-type transport system substrate-binding protein